MRRTALLYVVAAASGAVVGFYAAVGIVLAYRTLVPPRGPSDGGEVAVLLLAPFGVLTGCTAGWLLARRMTRRE